MNENGQNTRVPDEEQFKILIASDIHLGYAEREPGRENDSFNTFEEILQIAVSNDVDFILLGGDLFHDHKPSQGCLYRCMTLIRQYCMGDRPVSVEFVSDQSINFQHMNNPVVNYEDPNLNISIPIFSINGNHDDCSAVGVSAMDVLGTTGLVNYFAKWTDFKKVDIMPLLLRKGGSNLAIYGLSYMNDERLSRLFRDGKVRCFQQRDGEDQWFNLMVLHQNRADHGKYTFIPEEALPQFMDLVVWGHEHECRIAPEKSPMKDFYVAQPGSSVATSLCAGEAVEKNVGILRVYKKRFILEPVKLKTVRPFVMDTITLSKCNIERTVENPSKKVEEYVAAQVERMIEKSKEQLTGHKKQPTVPLIRLRVEYKEEWQIFNTLVFGLQFAGRVANLKDIVLLRLERAGGDRKKAGDINIDTSVVEFILQQEELQTSEGFQVEKVIEKYYETDECRKLKVFTVNGFGTAVKSLMDYGDDGAIEAIAERQTKSLLQYLKTVKATADTAEEEIENFHQRQLMQAEEEEKKDKAFLKQRADQFMKDPKNRATLDDEDVMEDGDSDVEEIGSLDDEDDLSTSSSSSVASGRRGRGGARARPRGPRAGRQQPPSSCQRSPSARPARGRGSRGPRGGARASNRSYGCLSMKDYL
ncbi:double-strand break repair protein MRE11 [Bacillus rossius redtenbacheri]|uniref:double-strand break repair protein MRE11 n=1 Tax=Bacillus rossius redtenbacheri TaxID=93214 RepID=UPI002FDD28F6